MIWLLSKTASTLPATIFSVINDEEMLYSQFIHLSCIHLSFKGKLTGKGRNLCESLGRIHSRLYCGPASHAPKCKCRTVYLFKHLFLCPCPSKMPVSIHPLSWDRAVWRLSYWTARQQSQLPLRLDFLFPPQLRYFFMAQAHSRLLYPILISIH